MFLKRRLEKTKKRMHACSDMICLLEKDPYLEVSNEAIEVSKQKLKNRLNDLTWRYLMLKMEVPKEVKQDPPGPHSELLTIKDLIDVIGSVRIRDGESFIRIKGLSEASIEALKRINRDCKDDETLMDRLLGEPAATTPRQLIDRADELLSSNVTPDSSEEPYEYIASPPISPYPDSPSVSISEEDHLPSVNDALEHVKNTGVYIVLCDLIKRITSLEMEHEEITLRDLDKAMRAETAKNDPSLHGDLALLLHRLRDPINHPVSLVELAESVASGECKDPNLVASALDMLVDEFRETIGHRKSFEASDRGCLEAMDIERNTLC